MISRNGPQSLDLIQLRRYYGVTQATFAKHMGLPLRTYEDLESGRSSVRPMHWNAAQFAAITLSATMPMRAPAELAELLQRVVP